MGEPNLKHDLVTIALVAGAMGICAANGIVNYRQGYSDGKTAEAALYQSNKSEHDRIMQFVGVCKWAKIMADDIRCKQELP